MSKTIKLAQSLIKIDSVTPNDKGCQVLMTDHLKQSNYILELHITPKLNVKQKFFRKHL